MKNKTYTVQFFKDMINQGSTTVKIDNDIQKSESPRNRDLENFFSALFTPPTS